MKESNKTEWTKVIDAQVNANKVRDQQEKMLQDLNRKIYKEELDRQLREKLQKAELVTKHKQQETQLVKQKAENLRDYEQKKFHERTYLKRQFANEYAVQEEQKTNQITHERSKEMQQDQQRLEMLSRHIQEDLLHQRQQKEIKSKVITDDYVTKLNYRERDRIVQEQEKRQQKELADFREQEQNSKIASRKEFVRNLSDNADRKSNMFAPVFQQEAEKKVNQSTLIHEWQKQKDQELSEKEAARRNEKYMAIQNTSDVIKSQLAQKEQQKKDVIESKLVDTMNVHRFQVANFNWETEMRLRRQKEKEDYSQALKYQAYVKDIERKQDRNMNEKEKKLHFSIIDKSSQPEPQDFIGVPGLNPREIPLEKILPRAIRSISPDLVLPESRSFSPIDHLNSMSSKFSSKSMANSFSINRNGGLPYTNSHANFELAFEPDRHNPITNPIGAVIPRPSNSPLFRGKGVPLLHAGTSIVLN